MKAHTPIWQLALSTTRGIQAVKWLIQASIWLPVVLVSHSTAAQEEIETAAQVQSILDDLVSKDKYTPTSELILSSERSWAQEQLSRVRAVTQRKSALPEYAADIEDVKDAVASLTKAFNSADCTKSGLQLIMQKLRVLARVDMVSPLYGSNSGSSARWESFVDANPDMMRSSVEDSKVKSLCDNLKGHLATNSWEATGSEFVGVMEAGFKNLKEEETNLVTKAKEAEERLKAYLAKLTEVVEKKSSVEKNLPMLLIIIGSLSLLAMLLVRLFPETVMKEWVISGQVIQFVTVMILLSAIMALGLSGILKENTLGTLLGGIAGYVLSQGVGKILQNAAKAPTTT